MPPKKFKPITEEELRSSVGARLRSLRGDMALEKVAKGARVAARGYFAIENGKASSNLRTLMRLANFYSLKVRELLP